MSSNVYRLEIRLPFKITPSTQFLLRKGSLRPLLDTSYYVEASETIFFSSGRVHHLFYGDGWYGTEQNAVAPGSSLVYRGLSGMSLSENHDYFNDLVSCRMAAIPAPTDAIAGGSNASSSVLISTLDLEIETWRRMDLAETPSSQHLEPNASSSDWSSQQRLH